MKKFKTAVSDRLELAFMPSAKSNEAIRSYHGAVAMTRLRVEHIVIITSLLLICGAYGQSAGGGSAYEDCMAQKTKSACDESEEACTQFLSDAGQRQARELCLQSERPAVPQAAASTAERPVAPQPAASTAEHPEPPQPVASTDKSPQPLEKSSRSDPLNSPQAEKQPEGSRSRANKQPQQRQRKESRPFGEDLFGAWKDQDSRLISPQAKKQPEGSRSRANKKPQQRQRKEGRPLGEDLFGARKDQDSVR